MKQILVGVAMILAVLSCAQGASAEVLTWTIDGQRRQAIVYAPATVPAGAAVPLVLSFHGRGDDMGNFQHTGVHTAWPEAVVVYFDGLEGRGGGLRGWQVVKGEEGDRDLKLVDAALASLRRKYRVDDARVYATGFSNGAAFTYLLWAERPAVFAAFAPVAGRIRPSVQPRQPRPLFHVAGVRDGTVLYSEQQAAITVAMAANGMAAAAETSCGNGCTIRGAGTSSPVMVWVHQGGHEYPSGTSARIARFFRDHPRAR